MKVVILAGGFGTRLARDIRNDASGKYKELLHLPKSLLPIGPKPLLSHWMKLFQESDDIEHVHIQTNDHFYEQFMKWSQEWPDFISVVNDKTSTNNIKLGAVAALAFAVSSFGVEQSDLIIVAGDTLFYSDFDLSKMIDQFRKLKLEIPTCSLVTVYDCARDDVVKHGILETNSQNRVTRFLEKPQPDETQSRSACPCFYILSPAALKEVSIFLEDKKNSPFLEKDATGNFLNHLYKRLPVFTHKISGRFDVGRLSSYLECVTYFDES
ncbi:uncharacterized protein LOC143459338 [Clavelina lepadiformis]|uniref:uncharacterized protein LOC143459338 n=1 Tax=Clavelina lepadiformis TaxID=159417 RepID=UPI004043353C